MKVALGFPFPGYVLIYPFNHDIFPSLMNEFFALMIRIASGSIADGFQC